MVNKTVILNEAKKMNFLRECAIMAGKESL